MQCLLEAAKSTMRKFPRESLTTFQKLSLSRSPYIQCDQYLINLKSKTFTFKMINDLNNRPKYDFISICM